MSRRRIPVCALIVLLGLPATSAAAPKYLFAGQLLKALPTRAETSIPPYARSKFKYWTDADSDGCDTREEVLHRQNLKRPAPNCRSQAGIWFSAYDGKSVGSAALLEIDHLIPPAEAWRSGAANAWDADTRKRFANDLRYRRTLVAVSRASKQSKGDKDPAKWLPPDESYTCQYAVNWVAVKYRWNLAVDADERDTLIEAMRDCPRALARIPAPPRAEIIDAE